MPVQIAPRELATYLRRPDITVVKVHKGEKFCKVKFRAPRYLYTAVLPKDRLKRLLVSIPPTMKVEIVNEKAKSKK